MESLNKQIGTNDSGLTQEPARTLSSLQRWLRTHLAQVLLTSLLAGLGVQLVSVIFRKCVTLDELVLIPSAYYYLVTDDFDLVREHPPLCKILSGLPVLFIQPNELRATPGDRTLAKIDLDWKYEMQFWQDNRERADMISFWARVPMIGLSLGVGWLIFVFARDVFGQWAALLSVVLFSLEPTILAHARVVQTDMPATFGFLLTAFALHRYLRAPTWKRAVGLGTGQPGDASQVFDDYTSANTFYRLHCSVMVAAPTTKVSSRTCVNRFYRGPRYHKCSLHFPLWPAH